MDKQNEKELLYAARYIRVSTEDQGEYSPDAQNRALISYAAANGYFVDDRYLYVDEGISGRIAEKRPAFMSMIAQAKSKEHPFDVILVHKFDRFARSREDSVVYKSLLRKECGVRVISVTESVEDDKFSIILEAMLEAMAEYYSINLAEEVKKGMTEKALRGGLQTTPPFGYRAQGNVLVPHSEEAVIVRELFRRFIVGQGYFALAKWLNDKGIRTRRGNLFENRTVEYIIRNPVYIGKLRWNPAGRSCRDYDHNTGIVADGSHEPLISEETWEAAQCRVHEVKAQWQYHKRPFQEKKDWLSGLVHCAACNSTMVFVKPHYWKCNGYVKGACTHSQHIGNDLLKEAILHRLQQDTETRLPISYTLVRTTGNPMDETALLTHQRRKLEDKIERLREAFLSGADSVEEYKTMKQTLQDEIRTVEKQITASHCEDLANCVENGKDQEVAAVKIQNAAQTALCSLTAEAAAAAQQHEAFQSIIVQCTWDKSQNLLQFGYRDLESLL